MGFRLNLKKLNLQVLFWVLLFIICLDSITDIPALKFMLKHLDEILTLIMLLYLILNCHLVMHYKQKPVLIWGITVVTGLLSSAIFRYQGILIAFIDAIVICSKFLIGYLAAFTYLIRHKNKVSGLFLKLARVITIVLFMLMIHEVMFPPIFSHGDFRYFMYGQQLIFPYATYLAFAAATILIYLGYAGNGRKNQIYMWMITIVGMSTLRSKALGFFVVYWIMYLSLKMFKNRNFFGILLMSTATATLIGWGQIKLTFLDTMRFSPRNILLKDSIALMKEHFPLGTGFGSFASSLAASNYSPLYIRLGYMDNRGMSPLDTSFLSDSFWPAIIAQTGIIGSVAFIALIIYFIKLSVNMLRSDKMAGVAMLAVMLYLLITSIAESAFFNPAALLMMMLFAMFECEGLRK